VISRFLVNRLENDINLLFLILSSHDVLYITSYKNFLVIYIMVAVRDTPEPKRHFIDTVKALKQIPSWVGRFHIIGSIKQRINLIKGP